MARKLYLGLDVHKEQTVIAILEGDRDAEPRHCDVIAPFLIPTRSGNRSKTDKRDAAKMVRSNEFVAVHVPDSVGEAIRTLPDPPGHADVKTTEIC